MAREPLTPGGEKLSPQQRTARLSIIAAAGLAALKLVTGLLTGSLAFIAEAAHSGTDLVAALLTFYALRVASRPADREHPYGHGKAEHLAALGEAAFLVLVSAAIVFESLRRLTGREHHTVDATWWAFAVLAVVLAVDISRATISWRASREHGSPALAANAVHFAADFAGSLAVLVGLVLVRAGYQGADAVAALVVAALVIAAGVALMRENVDVLMDRSPADADAAARAAIEAAEPRAELRRLRVREAAGRSFVDAVVAVAPDAGVQEGHAVADSIEQAVRAALPGSDVTVHIEPRASADLRERATGAALSVREVREVHNVRTVLLDGGIELSLHVKLPADETLAAAHGTADAVERAIIAAAPEVDRVHVHLEPLAAPQAARQPAPGEDDVHREAIAAIVRELSGSDPVDVRVHHEPRGLVAFVTVALPAGHSLAAAHETAGRIEARARATHPDIAEVVVHTEPGAALRSG
ncbi:MAG TPA: cation diffusion facilitator family transporter [Solirubrobacteraceae bacterium]|nr:cation diffusion facilitator family transporter [Solirubrobacteraceae bacterium]